MSGPIQLIRGREPRRARPHDRHLLPRPRGGRLRRDPPLGVRAVDDGHLDVLDRDRVRIDPEHAGPFTRRRAQPPGELRKVVRRVQTVYGRTPPVAIDQVVPVRNQVPERTPLMAERDAAVHAPRGLGPEVLLREGLVDLLPVAQAHGLQLHSDLNLIEADNVFEGERVSVGDGVLRSPSTWKHLWNPFRPSWGEPYVDIAARMRVAIEAARDAARGREAVCVSHQLPIWVARLDAEKRMFMHDPRKRQCNLASVTSFVYDDNTLVAVTYAEPAADLVEISTRGVGA